MFIRSLLMLTLALTFGCVSAEKYDALQLVNDGLQMQLAEEQSRSQSLAEALEGLKAELDRTQAELARVQEELAEAVKTRDSLQASLRASRNDLQGRIADLTKQKQDLQARISELEEEKRLLEAEAQRRVAETKNTYDALVDSLRHELEQGEVQISQLRGKLSVNVAERMFFDSGKAEIKPDGQELLRRVAAVLEQVPDQDIRVEGHTDNVPIGTRLRATYPTNWELASARAINVVRFLQDEGRLAPQRLHAVSFGQYRPLVPNDNEDNRRKNRRISIALVDPAVVSAPEEQTAATDPVTAPVDE